MKNKKLLIKKLKALGYPLFEEEETTDINSVLADVVKSKDLRMWEGFPVLLANNAEKDLFDYEMVKHHLSNSDVSTLYSLTSMSLALYKVLNIKFSWSKKLHLNMETFNEMVKRFRQGGEISIADNFLSTDRLINSFKNYYKQEESKLTDLIATKEEFNLEYAMSQIFSSKQKELFLKKLRGEKMTKTEREYYSRTVRKKVLALANSELYRLAQKTL